jgi:ATP synthase protein I
MKTPTPTRANPEDSLGLGMDAVIVLVLFGVAGYGLDRLFGTLPVLTIVLVVLGAVGVFARFKYRYEARMAEHEAARRGRANRNVPSEGVAASSDPEDRVA